MRRYWARATRTDPRAAWEEAVDGIGRRIGRYGAKLDPGLLRGVLGKDKVLVA